MTDDQECPHGLDARWCGVCLHGVTRPEPAPTVVRVIAAARYGGDCSACDLPIVLGERIALLTNGRYVHEGCAP